MLASITLLERFQSVGIPGPLVSVSDMRELIEKIIYTSVHGAHHTGDKPVNAPAFFDQRHEGGYTAFIVGRISEV